MKIIVLVLLLLGSLVAIDMFIVKSPVGPERKSETGRVTDAPIACNKTPLPANIEGPYYKEGSPERGVIRDENTIGTSLALTGYVYDTNCNPISRAWIDFWQTDGAGNYDNEGYKLRGHQYTDTNGKYYLTTVIPGEYPGRTPHIHVKIKPTENSQVITTQLYIPNVEKNKKDTFFKEKAVVNVTDSANGIKATFDFVLRID